MNDVKVFIRILLRTCPQRVSSHLQCARLCLEIVYSCTVNSYLHYVLICAVVEECLAAALNRRVDQVSLRISTTPLDVEQNWSTKQAPHPYVSSPAVLFTLGSNSQP